MANFFEQSHHFLRNKVWELDLTQVNRVQRAGVKTLRLFLVLLRDFARGQLNLHAMSLVYTTLLSLVPLLAVSFSVLKAFGVHNQVEPLLEQFLAPLGERGAEITDTVLRFVDNINVGVLGSVGLALLFYTVVSLIAKIEDTFNFIWRIKSARHFVQRFSDYISVLLIGPVLVFSAVGLTASTMNASFVQRIIAYEPFGTAIVAAGIIAPYLLTIAAFTFVYVFLPNTRVRFKPALIGATAAGVLWKSAGWVFAVFAQGSTRYDAIYSSFAILIMFMIWIYVSWLIFILGSQIAFYIQHPEFIRLTPPSRGMSNRLKERLALIMMYWIADGHMQGRNDWDLDRFSHETGVPGDLLSTILGGLEASNILVETSDDPPAYVPARSMDTMQVKDVIHAVRTFEHGEQSSDYNRLRIPQVDTLVERMDTAMESIVGEMSVREWVTAKHKHLKAISASPPQPL